MWKCRLKRRFVRFDAFLEEPYCVSLRFYILSYNHQIVFYTYIITIHHYALCEARYIILWHRRPVAPEARRTPCWSNSSNTGTHGYDKTNQKRPCSCTESVITQCTSLRSSVDSFIFLDCTFSRHPFRAIAQHYPHIYGRSTLRHARRHVTDAAQHGCAYGHGLPRTDRQRVFKLGQLVYGFTHLDHAQLQQ
jgi:hypothetical protein